MADHDWRIAGLLRGHAGDAGRAAARAGLSRAAAAGFRVVALDPATTAADRVADCQAEARRLGLHVVVLAGAGHYRLEAPLGDAQRRALARELSRDGFDGLVLCDIGDIGDGGADVAALLASARALLRAVDKADWTSYQ